MAARRSEWRPKGPAARHPLVKSYRIKGDTVWQALNLVEYDLDCTRAHTGYSARLLNALLRIIERNVAVGTLPARHRAFYRDARRHVSHVRACGKGSCAYEIAGIKEKTHASAGGCPMTRAARVPAEIAALRAPDGEGTP